MVSSWICFIYIKVVFFSWIFSVFKGLDEYIDLLNEENMSERYLLGGNSSIWQCMGFQNSLPPRDTPNPQLQMKQVSLKWTLTLAEQLLHNKKLNMGRRSRDMVSIKYPPSMWWPSIRRALTNVEFLPEEWGPGDPHEDPQPLGSPLENWTPKPAGFENPVGLCPGDPKGCRKLRFHW